MMVVQICSAVYLSRFKYAMEPTLDLTVGDNIKQLCCNTMDTPFDISKLI